jgi:hypothetical protein
MKAKGVTLLCMISLASTSAFCHKINPLLVKDADVNKLFINSLKESDFKDLDSYEKWAGPAKSSEHRNETIYPEFGSQSGSLSYVMINHLLQSLQFEPSIETFTEIDSPDLINANIPEPEPFLLSIVGIGSLSAGFALRWRNKCV